MAEFFWHCPNCGQKQRAKEAEAVGKLCPFCAEVAEEAEQLAEAVEREAHPRPSSRKGK